jgi:hypothetical protein
LEFSFNKDFPLLKKVRKISWATSREAPPFTGFCPDFLVILTVDDKMLHRCCFQRRNRAGTFLNSNNASSNQDPSSVDSTHNSKPTKYFHLGRDYTFPYTLEGNEIARSTSWRKQTTQT